MTKKLAFLDYIVNQFDDSDDKRKLVSNIRTLDEEKYPLTLLDLEDNEFWLVNNDKVLTDKEYKQQAIKKLVADWEKSGREGHLCDRILSMSNNLYMHVSDNSFTSIRRKEERNKDVLNHNRYNNPFVKDTKAHELYETYLLSYAREVDYNESADYNYHYELNRYLLWRLYKKQLTYDSCARWMFKHGKYDDDSIERFLIEANEWSIFSIRRLKQSLNRAKRSK